MNLALNQILILALVQSCLGAASAQQDPFFYSALTQSKSRPAMTVSFELDEEKVSIAIDESDWTVTIDGEDAPAQRFKARSLNLTLLDEYGSQVAMVTAGPSNLIVAFSTRVPKRAYLGIDLKPITAVLASHLDLEPAEVSHIVGVKPKSPAEKAGIEANDILLSIDGKTPATKETLRAVLKEKKPKDTLELKVLRRGGVEKVEVILAAASGVWGLPYSAFNTLIGRNGDNQFPNLFYQQQFPEYKANIDAWTQWSNPEYKAFQPWLNLQKDRAVVLPSDNTNLETWYSLLNRSQPKTSAKSRKSVEKEKARLAERIEKLEEMLELMKEKDKGKSKRSSKRELR